MPISQAVYTTTASGSTVTIYTKKPLVLNPPLLLTIKAADLLDALGRPLDGNGSGQPGANFVATLSKTGVSVDSARVAGHGLIGDPRTPLSPEGRGEPEKRGPGVDALAPRGEGA